MGRTIFIGDVHGCIEELKELLRQVKWKDTDRIILLGDLINRGPAPVEVVRFVYENRLESLMGNHEYDYLKEYRNNPVYASWKEIWGEEIHSWLEKRPLFIEEEDFIAVHAGLHPDYTLKETPPEILLNIRTLGKKSISSHDGIPWYNFYRGKKPVIYGHWARQGLTVRENTIGLDTGCVYGRTLTAYILEEKKFIQVPAKKVYYHPGKSKN